MGELATRQMQGFVSRFALNTCLILEVSMLLTKHLFLVYIAFVFGGFDSVNFVSCLFLMFLYLVVPVCVCGGGGGWGGGCRWLSVGSDLKFDARRDLDDVGAMDVEGKLGYFFWLHINLGHTWYQEKCPILLPLLS